MKLKHIEIRSLEGLGGSLSARFSADTTNFITGPNASGKSSIVRAVRAVLFPETSPGFCDITTRWEVDGRQLEARRQGDRVYWYDSGTPDRKSTRLNSSHVAISYAVFCLQKKTAKTTA